MNISRSEIKGKSESETWPEEESQGSVILEIRKYMDFRMFTSILGAFYGFLRVFTSFYECFPNICGFSGVGSRVSSSLGLGLRRNLGV